MQGQEQKAERKDRFMNGYWGVESIFHRVNNSMAEGLSFITSPLQDLLKMDAVQQGKFTTSLSLSLKTAECAALTTLASYYLPTYLIPFSTAISLIAGARMIYCQNEGTDAGLAEMARQFAGVALSYTIQSASLGLLGLSGLEALSAAHFFANAGVFVGGIAVGSIVIYQMDKISLDDITSLASSIKGGIVKVIGMAVN